MVSMYPVVKAMHHIYIYIVLHTNILEIVHILWGGYLHIPGTSRHTAEMASAQNVYIETTNEVIFLKNAYRSLSRAIFHFFVLKGTWDWNHTWRIHWLRDSPDLINFKLQSAKFPKFPCLWLLDQFPHTCTKPLISKSSNLADEHSMARLMPENILVMLRLITTISWFLICREGFIYLLVNCQWDWPQIWWIDWKIPGTLTAWFALPLQINWWFWAHSVLATSGWRASTDSLFWERIKLAYIFEF